MSTIESTSGNLFGTPVDFLPVPTPWPSFAGCAEGIYRQVNEGTILAWDPVYTRWSPDADTCFPPQQRLWWDQSADANPSTALGPTFVCPEAYNAVHSTVLESNSASQAHYTYCCPKQFTLGAILPQNQRSIIQCSSIADPGVTIPYISVTFLVTSLTRTGDDGTATVQASSQLTHVPVETVVRSKAATVYAPPINGYNIVRQTSSSQSTASEAASTELPSGTGGAAGSGGAGESGGLTTGAIVGIVVGVVLGLGLLALGAFFVWRRYRRPPFAAPLSEPGMYHEEAKGYYGSPYAPVRSEMPVESPAQEMEHSPYGYELPTAR
ncbi:hypothetical protein B0I37DRAFT_363314 [Chaetomium sp. MPI-CAGE-AT-0009]|nr:hypothetical protein B0I37DRAFT_363314 [Chaetomium sp. MPI-CAGE-AT-0009]